MPDWYYRDKEDRIIGPLRPNELLAMIRGGDLSEDTLVRKDDSPWVRSVEINGLWSAAARPDAEFFCPVCNAEINKPPCRCPRCMKYVEKGVGRLKKSEVSAKQLAKIRETANQAIPPVQHQTHGNVEQSAHSQRPSSSNATVSSRWWHSLLPRKK
jgi:hypothetical protein